MTARWLSDIEIAALEAKSRRYRRYALVCMALSAFCFGFAAFVAIAKFTGLCTCR